MSAPEPMLSTAIRSWPAGGDWVLEPKFDGFRVLVEVGVMGVLGHGLAAGRT